MTHSDAGGLSTVMKFDGVERAEEERLPALRPGLHRGRVEGVRPARRAETPEVEHRGAEQEREQARPHPRRGRGRDRGGTLGARRPPGAVRVTAAGAATGCVATRRRLRRGGGAFGDRGGIEGRGHRVASSVTDAATGGCAGRRLGAEQDAVEDHELRDPERAPRGDVRELDDGGAGEALEPGGVGPRRGERSP